MIEKNKIAEQKEITIAPETRINSILKMDPNAIEVLVDISKHFKKLRNPFLRKALAPRVTVAQAASIGKVSVEEFLHKLKEAGFTVNFSQNAGKDHYYAIPELVWQSLDPEAVITLDVREDIKAGRDPFDRIMDSVAKVPANGFMLIINEFEPWPLIKVMTKKGWKTRMEQSGSVVKTYFHKPDNGETSELIAPKSGEVLDEAIFDQFLDKFGANIQTLDVRNLEMPLPMVTILQSLDKLAESQALFVHHQRIPKFLLPQLDERGFQYCFKKAGGEEVKMLIYKDEVNE